MKTKVSPQLGGSVFPRFCYSILGEKISCLYPRLSKLRLTISKADMDVSFKEYVCVMCFLSVLSGAGSLIALLVFAQQLLLLTFPYLDGFGPVIISVPVGAITFLILYFIPFRRVSARRKHIETLLPVTSSYMSVLASAKIPPESIVRAVAKADPHIVLSREFKAILMKSRLLGYNTLTSLEKEADRSPSTVQANFLRELSTTNKSGGNLKSFFLVKTNQLLERRNLRVEQFLRTLELVGEMAVLIFTVFPLMMIIMLSMMSSLGGAVAGFNIIFLMNMITFLVIPIVAGFYLLILDGIHSNELNLSAHPKMVKQVSGEKDSVTTKRPKTNLIIAIASPGMFILVLLLGMMFAPINFTSTTPRIDFSITLAFEHFLTLGLILALIPPSIVCYLKSKHREAVDDNLPILLRNVGEAGAIGLSLRKAIELSAEHDYGPITKELRKVVVQLSWRVPLGKALKSFGERCDTQLARTTAFLISEANRAGGKMKDSIETIIAHIQELENQEKRMRMQMKPQVGIIYIAFMVFLVTAFILAEHLFTSLSGTPGIGLGQGINVQINFEDIKNNFFYMAIIEGFFSGLAGGKLSTGSIKNGFIHAAVLCTFGLVVFTVM